MSPKEAIELLKECATLVQCNYASRVKLVDAINTLEKLIPPEAE